MEHFTPHKEGLTAELRFTGGYWFLFKIWQAWQLKIHTACKRFSDFFFFFSAALFHLPHTFHTCPLAVSSLSTIIKSGKICWNIQLSASLEIPSLFWQFPRRHIQKQRCQTHGDREVWNNLAESSWPCRTGKRARKCLFTYLPPCYPFAVAAFYCWYKYGVIYFGMFIMV